MSIANCIANLKISGDLDEATAKELEKNLIEFKTSSNHIGDDVSLVKKFSSEKKQKIFSDIMTAKQYLKIKEKIKGTDETTSHSNLRALLEFDYTGKFKYNDDTPSDVWTLSKTYSGYYSKDLVGMLELFRSKIPGGLDFKTKARVSDIRSLVKSIYGESVDNQEVSRMAKAYSAANKAMVTQLRKLGAPARYAENFMPQNWDPVLIHNMGESKYIALMEATLDMSKTHGGFDDVAKFREYLKENYHDVVTNGLHSTVKKDSARNIHALGAGGSGLFRERSFQFKDADSFLMAHEQIGQGDVFENLIKNIDSAARELALTRVFGPNFSSNFDRLNNIALEGIAKGTSKLPFSERVGNQIASNKKIFNYLSGSLEGEEVRGVGEFMASLRALKLSASLGASVLSSIADFATTKQAAKLVGIPISNIAKNYAKLLVGNKMTRAQVGATGNIIDSIVTGSMSAARLVDDQFTGKFGQFAHRASEAVIRGSGLARHTQSIKNAMQLAINVEYASNAMHDFASLPKAQKNWLTTTGITSSDWDNIRAAVSADGTYIEPGNIKHIPSMEKWLSSNIAATRIAVPEPSAFAHVSLGAAQARGTFSKEARATLGQLWSYNISVTHIQAQLLRNNILLATKGSKIGYVAGYLAYGAMFAALGAQMKSLKEGNDLRSPEDPGLYLDAMIQTTGVPGDLLQRILTSSDAADVAKSLAGPIPGLALATIVTSYSAGKHVIDGDSDKARKQAASLLNELKKGLVPGQNLWYTKVAIDRLVFDQLQKAVDPRASSAFRRSQRSLEKRTGQEMWWEKGDLLPSRLPEVSNPPR